MAEKKCECKAGKNYIGVGGGVLIFNDKKEVLLMKRGEKSKNEIGWWAKPGGALDFGETAMEMAKREIKEELDIEIEIWGQLPHTDHILKNENQHWIAINFLADIKSGEPKIMEPEKCEKLGWFALNELPENIVQYTIEGINFYKEGKYIKL